MTQTAETAGGRATAGTRLLLVVAHPDDETFGCGSLLLHAAERGLTTAVVCATRGEAGEAAGSLTAMELGAIRERELRAAATSLGVSRVGVLAFHDSGMAGPSAPGALVDAPMDAVIDQVRDHIDHFRPHVVVTLDAGDGHRDHVIIREATLAAVERARWQVASVYLHCLPTSLMTRWVDYMSEHDPSWEHLRGQVPGTPDDLITTVIDTAAHLDDRQRAIGMHASQRSPYDALPEGLLHAFLSTEHLRRVRPPWTGGRLESDLDVGRRPDPRTVAGR
jgi:LmbE family N-acetylglucosaminyl deacetylase